ncbi:MAG: hypothetical protein SVQ76_02215 [Candidatus Nanohaloarchaea archaeon]|nr:hypothetical protein [Candidatus Nanohaloarchaea archaeon]
MYWSGRGQSQVLTAVLLGGILVAGVSAAYIWGLPILRKNQDVNNAEKSLSDLEELASAISTVASQGGSRTVTIKLADGSIRVNTDNETITYRTLTQGAYVSTQEWVPLNENDMQGVNRSTGLPGEGYGIRGVDKPVLLVGQAEKTSNAFMTVYRIVSRMMFEPNTGQSYRIDLVQNGNLQASTGTREVTIRRGEQVTESGEGIEGGTLQKVQILVRVS